MFSTFADLYDSVRSEVVATVALAAFLVCALQIINWTAARRKATEDQRFWKLTHRNIATIIFIFGALFIWKDGLQSILLALGAATAGFLIAFREAWLSFLGFWSRMVRLQYDVNDFIYIDGIRGRVIDITWFSTVVAQTHEHDHQQYTGQVVHIPNNRMLISALEVENFTGRFAAHGFDVSLPKGTDYADALAYEVLLNEAAIMHCSPYFEAASAHMARLKKTKALDTPRVKPVVSFQFKKEGEVCLHVRIVVPQLEKNRIEQAIIKEFLHQGAALQCKSMGPISAVN